MTEKETGAAILHEIGEAMAGAELGVAWEQLVFDVAGTRAELVARAVRDHLADCLSTLPSLLGERRTASLHFFFANLEGMRRQLFPAALEAYELWNRTNDDSALRELAARAVTHWRRAGDDLLTLHRSGFTRDNDAIRSCEERIQL